MSLEDSGFAFSESSASSQRVPVQTNLESSLVPDSRQISVFLVTGSAVSVSEGTKVYASYMITTQSGNQCMTRKLISAETVI